MAHFAKINFDNVVEQVIVINNEILLDENEIEIENLGSEFCSNLFGGRWIQTSYNNKFRGRFATNGMIYDEVKDEFIAPIAEITEEVNESISE